MKAIGYSSGSNENIAKDVFGYSLSYYDGDFSAIGAQSGGTISIGNHSIADITSSVLNSSSPDLFNGNIRHMITAIKPFLGGNGEPQAMSYKYDQLNRIAEATAYSNIDVTNNNWQSTGSFLSAYHEEYTYDPNGNIITLNRKGDNAVNYNMDDFTYHYTSGTNQLDYVSDNVTAGNYNMDVDNQSSGNYDYDKIGNLIQDNAEGIDDIEWTVYGKIKSITKNNSANITNNITFQYSPDGHRVSKKVQHKNIGGTVLYTQTTYYVRDAQGNIMATYMMSHDTFFWQSSHIYGSSRLGEYTADVILDINGAPQGSSLATGEFEFLRGKKKFELSNHLGNVLVVVSDKRTLICVGGNQYYEADILSASDYYPFGMTMPARSFTNESYAFGFNGIEKDNEIKGAGNSLDFGARIYDSRLGRWLALDPLQKKYTSYSPYHFGYCNPIVTIDVDGKENIVVVGGQSKTVDPKSDRTNPDFGQEAKGHSKRHFLEKGLNEAIRLKENNTENGEQTTIIVYKCDYSKAELKHYADEAHKNGINFIVAKKEGEITNYIGWKDKKAKKDQRQGESETDKGDLITDFAYVGHGSSNGLLIGYSDDGAQITITELCSDAFAKDGEAILWGCNNGNSGGLAEQMVEGGHVSKSSGYEGTVWWGVNKDGKFGVGEARDSDTPEAPMKTYEAPAVPSTPSDTTPSDTSQ